MKTQSARYEVMGFHNPADFPKDKRKLLGNTELTNRKTGEDLRS